MIRVSSFYRIFLFLFLCLGIPTFAQDADDDFVYDDETNSVIIGVNSSAWSKATLTIPGSVTTVCEDAFFGCTRLKELYIDGGNPYFETNAFNDDVLAKLQYLNTGTGMSAENIRHLVLQLGVGHQVETIDIGGYLNADEEEIDWSGSSMKDILTEDVSVRLPAALVGNQVFGDAQVWGRFTLNGELGTFCGTANFQEMDSDSQFLFYVPTELRTDSETNTKEIFIERVRYVVAGEGVLMHRIENTSDEIFLLRVETAPSYDTNMLVGVTEPTYIGKTENDMTNLILYQGKFHPTSGGTLGANRAYLQLPTASLEGLGDNGALAVTFDTSAADGIITLDTTPDVAKDPAWYSIGGQRLNNRPTQPGVYLHGKKVEVVK